MIYKISSKDNKNIKFARQLKRKSFRTENKKFIAEGRKIVLEALRFAFEDVCFIIMTDVFLDREPDAASEIEALCEKTYVVPENVFNEISDTDTPQGVLAVINMKEEQFSPSDDTKEVLVLDGVSEPGNMGTVIRTAEALGYDGIYLTKGSADIYSPKTVRATMGSVFRMKFRRNCTIDDISNLQKDGFSIIATTPGGSTKLEEFKPPERLAIVIGNEAHGVCGEILDLADYGVKITMDGMAESLNAAVASGIVMHWLKQR